MAQKFGHRGDTGLGAETRQIWGKSKGRRKGEKIDLGTEPVCRHGGRDKADVGTQTR